MRKVYLYSFRLVTIARWTHLFPYRTQKLSISTAMVLGWRRPGRVASRQTYSWVAQWWSNRLLTGRLWVRVPPQEPKSNAGVAELADAQDLKSCGPSRPYRFDSGLRHQDGAGWSSLVARRAHNPEVVGSNPAPAIN